MEVPMQDQFGYESEMLTNSSATEEINEADNMIMVSRNIKGKKRQRMRIVGLLIASFLVVSLFAGAISHLRQSGSSEEPESESLDFVAKDLLKHLKTSDDCKGKSDCDVKSKDVKCSLPGENCSKTHCCAWDGMQCYEKNEHWANCRTACTPGPDFFDSNPHPWSCKKLGPRKPGKGLEPAPPKKLPKWVKTHCAKPGTDCRKAQCCAWEGMQCFEKMKGWATCKSSCVEGPDFTDVDSTSWSCKTYGPRTPGKGLDPPTLAYEKLPKWVASHCAKDGADCSKSKCCVSQGTQCYQKKEGWAVCMASCEPGPHFFDISADPWTCKMFGPRTPGKAPPPPAPMTFEKLPKWVASKCAKDGTDCSKSMCCQSPGMQCYRKKEGWATCKPRCIPGPDPNDNNEEWSCKALGPRTPIKCPACSPKTRTALDVVIPFFERDLCKLKYTAKSLSVNDPDKNFGTVHLMWISKHDATEYQGQIDEIKQSISSTHTVRFTDFAQRLRTSTIAGWHAQQLLKLKIASEVTSDFYLVMDSKNTIVRPIKSDMFFTPCNQGKIQAEFPWYKIPVPHSDWYARSANALSTGKPSSGFWPASITPIIMHKQSVLGMLKHLGEGSSTATFCEGNLCEKIGAHSSSGHGATEFTLYTLYVYQNVGGQTDLKCIHSVEQMQRFKVEYGPNWKGDLEKKLLQSNFPTDKRQITVSDGNGWPLSWDPSQMDSAPGQDQFPLKFEDLTKRWAASLWRGEPSNAAKLESVNLHTLSDIVNGVRQFPVMFGAQPASTKAMSPANKPKALADLVTMYKKANLYFANSAQDLEACVVGYHN